MNDSKKNDSAEDIEIESMHERRTDCNLLHLVKELQAKNQALERELRVYREADMPLDQALQFLCPTGHHLRIAEGSSFPKAMATIAADLLVGRIRVVGTEVLVGGYPLELHDISRVFRELQRALQRCIVTETMQRKEILISASSCLLSTRLLKNVSESSYSSEPKMLQFKKHLVRTVGRTKL